MLHAVARDAPGADLAPIAHELAQRHDVFVVDVVDTVLAEHAELALALLLPALVVLVAPALLSFPLLRWHYTGASSWSAPPPTGAATRSPQSPPLELLLGRDWRSTRAVAHRGLGPTSSASISMAERLS